MLQNTYYQNLNPTITVRVAPDGQIQVITKGNYFYPSFGYGLCAVSLNSFGSMKPNASKLCIT
uniref:Uncharacterized protein n=1 Tax=Arundo donax TaxID=35708 RepID=A0A0A9GJG8_ARUDO